MELSLKVKSQIEDYENKIEAELKKILGHLSEFEIMERCKCKIINNIEAGEIRIYFLDKIPILKAGFFYAQKR